MFTVETFIVSLTGRFKERELGDFMTFLRLFSLSVVKKDATLMIIPVYIREKFSFPNSNSAGFQSTPTYGFSSVLVVLREVTLQSIKRHVKKGGKDVKVGRS